MKFGDILIMFADCIPITIEHKLPPETIKDLKNISEKYGFTLNTVLITAWSIVLSHYSANDDVLFGTTVSIRPPDVELDSVGLYINTIPVVVKVDHHITVMEMLKRAVRQQVYIHFSSSRHGHKTATLIFLIQ